MLAVSVLSAIAYLRLIFKDDYLLAAAIAIYLGQHSGAFDSRLTNHYIIAIGNKQDLVQLDCAAFGYSQTFYFDSLAFGYLILFAACFNNSVNFGPPD